MDGRLRVLCLTNKMQIGGHECGRLTFAKSIDQNRFDYRFLTITETPELSNEELIASAYLHPLFAAAGFPIDSLGERDSRRDGTRGLTTVLTSSIGIWRTIRRLVRYIRENEIEVIDAHHTVAMFAGAIASRLTGVPLVLTAYNIAPWQRPGMNWAGQIAFRQASAIITDSRLRRDEIDAWCPNKSAPILTIPTGVFPPQPVKPSAEMRREIGIPDSPGIKVIGMIAAFMEFKGHEDLLDAAIEVLRHEHNVVFLCQGASRGQTEYETRLQRRITEAGLSDRFILRMVSGEIGDVWQLFDIFAHPTRFDSLPLVVLEAMSLGKPSVVTSIGGIPDVVEHEHTGLVVPSQNPGKMAQALLHLLRNPEAARSLGEAAQERYQDSVSPERMAWNIERVFLEVAENAAPARAA